MVFIKSKVTHFHFLIKSPASYCHRMMDYVSAHDRGFRLYILSKFIFFIYKKKSTHTEQQIMFYHMVGLKIVCMDQASAGLLNCYISK